jgi:hypothetical protein
MTIAGSIVSSFVDGSFENLGGIFSYGLGQHLRLDIAPAAAQNQTNPFSPRRLFGRN